MRELYAYVANEPTRRLAEDGMSMGLTNKHTARGFSVVSRVRSKTMHSLFCIMSPYTTLCNIASRFILRMALLGCRLAASHLRKAARWQ